LSSNSRFSLKIKIPLLSSIRGINLKVFFQYFSQDKILTLYNNQKLRLGIFLLSSVCILYFGLLRFLEYRIFESRIQVNQIRSFITDAINQELHKAVDLGIIEFSLWEGILLEDLMISQDEDFTFNHKLLQSRKIGLKLSSLFSHQPYIKRIKIIDPIIQVNTTDDYFNSLVEYLLKVNIQELEFSGLRLDLLEGENVLISIKEKSDWVFKKENNKIYFSFNNGWFWIPFVTRIQGQGVISLSEGKSPQIQFNARWKNLSSSEINGLSSWMHLFNSSNGETHGSIEIQSNDIKQSVKSDSDWVNMEGHFIFWKDEHWKNFSFHSNFQYNKIFELKDNEHKDNNLKNINSNIVTYSREYRTDFGDWLVSSESIQGIENGKIRWNISSMKLALDNLLNWENTSVEGKLNGSLDWKESGTRNNWFLFNLENSWQSGKWKDKNINLEWEDWKTSVVNNQLKSEFKGLLFDSKLTFIVDTKIQFWKSTKPDKTNYYPVGIHGNINSKLDSIQLDDWIPMKNSIFVLIQKEIKERQEKILPEEFFTQLRIYKYLLEEMNLVWNGSIGKIVTNKNEKPMLEWNSNLTIQTGRLSLKLNQKNSSNTLAYSTTFASRTPYMEFSMILADVSWNKETFQICGFDIIPKTLDLDYRFRSSGSDIYTITKQSNQTSIWNLKNTKMVRSIPNGQYSIPLPGWNPQQEFILNFSIDHFFENSYYRDILLSNGIETEWKGYGSLKNSQPSFSLFGKVGTEYKTIQFVEEGNICR
jgi:hypothetical protein